MFLTTTKPEMDCVSEPKCMSKASGVDFPNNSLSWSSLTSSSMRGTEALGFPPLPFFFRSFFFTLRPFLLFQTRSLLLRCSLNFFSSNTFQSWLTYHAMNGLIIFVLVFLSHCYNELSSSWAISSTALDSPFSVRNSFSRAIFCSVFFLVLRWIPPLKP